MYFWSRVLQYKKGVCRECGNDTLLANASRKLCCYCNKKRLNEGKKNKKSSFRTKYSGDSDSVKEAYKFIDENRPHRCTGCGTPNLLSHSHIIPRSVRKDLEDKVDNITFHCMSMGTRVGCHTKWESGRLRHTLNDYEKNMRYIEGIDPQYYHKLKDKEEKYANDKIQEG